MAETICPVVDGAKLEGHKGAVIAHVAGTTIGAALMGALLGGIGLALRAPWGSATPASIALAAALSLAATWGLPIPQLEGRRQVPEWWRTFFRPRPAAFMYGAALGIGFPFHLRYLTLTLVAVAVVATGNIVAGVGVMGLFGFFRGLVVTPALRGGGSGGETADLWLNRVALTAMLLVAGAMIVSG